jgi:hypothetical protein
MYNYQKARCVPERVFCVRIPDVKSDKNLAFLFVEEQHNRICASNA